MGESEFDLACKELELNRAKGWKRTSLNFLNDLSHLKSLTIIDFNITEIQPIHSLESLQYLDINTYCKSPIDFSCLVRILSKTVHRKVRLLAF